MKQAQRQWIWTPTTEQEIKSMPFKECAVDLIGPWIVQVHGKPLEFNALTAIDTITNLVELVRIDNKTLAHDVAQQFTQLWLAWYPWPEWCVHDKVENSLDPNSRRLCNNAKSKMSPPQQRTHRQIPYASECIKQLAMSYASYYTANRPRTYPMQKIL